MNDLIGVFDSGLGGITVLQQMCRLMPNEHFLFYGDNAHAPYGVRTPEDIRRLTEKSIDVLLRREVKAVVIACNTATSAYGAILRGKVTIPVVGMEPAIKPAQEVRHGGLVPVFATRATLALPKFHDLMQRYGEGMVPMEGKGWVEIVESGRYDTPEAEAAVRALLREFDGRQIDALVLGCTHYPYMLPIFRRLVPGIPIFDGRRGTARQLKKLLEENDLCTADTQGSVEFLTSGTDADLEKMRRMFAVCAADEADHPSVEPLYN